MQGLDRVCLAIIAVGAMCNGIAACAESEQTSAVIMADLAPTQSKPETSGVEPESVDEQLIFAKEDLASRLGDDAGEIELVSVRHVQWRSGAIGCPAHGMAHTMAITGPSSGSMPRRQARCMPSGSISVMQISGARSSANSILITTIRVFAGRSRSTAK